MENSNSSEVTPGAGVEVLDDVASFIRKYLVCDDHQLTILTLWSAHTWCFQLFPATPYLDLRSPQQHSGKTRCLRLLDRLCHASAFSTGAPAKTIMDRLLATRDLEELTDEDGIVQIPKPLTFLLDDCHHTFGPSERQPLVAMLNSGSDMGCTYASGGTDYYLYSPKAFAGNAPLPPSLAARCVPVVLQRPRPSDQVVRLESEEIQAKDLAANLAGRIENWINHNALLLKQQAQNRPAQLPPALSPASAEFGAFR